MNPNKHIYSPDFASDPIQQQESSVKSLFSANNQFILGEGVYKRLTLPPSSSDFVETINNALEEAEQAGIKDPILLGALPFDPAENSDLIIPLSTYRFSASELDTYLNHEQSESRVLSVRENPPGHTYRNIVSAAVERFKQSSLDKVVLSRTLKAEFDTHIDPVKLTRKLINLNPGAFHFMLPLVAGETLLGASPELLVEKEGNIVTSNPLAGTCKRHLEPSLDTNARLALAKSEKDLNEHAFVAAQVGETLTPYCEVIDIPRKPSVISTANLWHLSTRISGQLKSNATHVLDLVKSLHPTPAVCGHPPMLARDTIKELEPFERGHFTGAVGWCDRRGNGQWAVTIRCAQVANNELTLSAGAGVVAASCPQSEYQETAAKLDTLLNALNIKMEFDTLC